MGMRFDRIHAVLAFALISNLAIANVAIEPEGGEPVIRFRRHDGSGVSRSAWQRAGTCWAYGAAAGPTAVDAEIYFAEHGVAMTARQFANDWDRNEKRVLRMFHRSEDWIGGELGHAVRSVPKLSKLRTSGSKGGAPSMREFQRKNSVGFVLSYSGGRRPSGGHIIAGFTPAEMARMGFITPEEAKQKNAYLIDSSNKAAIYKLTNGSKKSANIFEINSQNVRDWKKGKYERGGLTLKEYYSLLNLGGYVEVYRTRAVDKLVDRKRAKNPPPPPIIGGTPPIVQPAMPGAFPGIPDGNLPPS